MYKNGRAKSLAIRNKYLAPPLWATVCQVLQDISYLANPVYVNTDGFVFDDLQEAGRFMMALDAYNLPCHVTQGYGEIRGWNLYQIGNRKTALFDQRPRAGGRPFDNRLPRRERSFLEWWSKIPS